MKFLKGNRNEFEKLKDDSSWEDKAEIIQRQMAEVFGSKNLSFLMGSGCSSLRHEDDELGIPTMKFLAEAFQELLAADADAAQAFVSAAQKTELYDKLGIDLSADDVKGNLEQMMAVLINAHKFCRTSDKEALNAVAPLVENIIIGIKKFVLYKCTTGPFSNGDSSVVALYRRFYQSLTTRARGLTPPWVFSTNYDLFNERAMDRSGIPYSNGFSGTVERRFNPATYRLALAEQLDITSRRWAAVDGFVHFCKLHGSVNWTEEDILHKLSGILRGEGKAHLSDRVYLWPARGAPKTPMYAAFVVGHGWDSGVLLDTDAEGHAAKEKIEELTLKDLADEQKARFRVLMLGKAAGIKKTDAAIEDLFDDQFYIDCVNAAFGIAIKPEDLPVDGSDMVTKRVEKVLVQRYGHKNLDKGRVMAEMLRRFDGFEKVADLPKGTAARAEKLFGAINSAFMAATE